MEGRATLLGRWLLAASFLVCALLVSPPAEAQQPRLAISEINWEFTGTDRTREYFEIANLGDQPWNPNGSWLFRWRGTTESCVAEASKVVQLFRRIEGVQPIPPNGVLQIEWGKPFVSDPENGDIDTPCTTGANFLCVPGLGFATDDFNGSDLEIDTALAVFAPTSNNQAPSVDNGTMLAYYIQLGEKELADTNKAEAGYTKAVQSGLWKDGDIVQPRYVENWSRALRMGPGPYPADHGRKGADYYATLAGHARLDNDNMTNAVPNIPPPNTPNRAGTPGKVNYLHPGTPIPGQIAAGVLSVRAPAVAASLAAGAPAAMQIVGVGSDGRIVSSLFANNAWSPAAVVAGAPVADGATLVNNPVKGSRTLILRAKADGALSAHTSAGSDAAFTGNVALGLQAKFAPAAVVDAAGNEHYVAVDNNGAIQHNINANGTLRGWRAIAGATTDVPVAAAFTTNPAGLNVLAFIGNQLTLYRLGADGNFGPGTNAGSAVTARPAGIGPILEWNTPASRLEILAVVGTPTVEPDGGTGAAVHHARAELSSVGAATVGALTAIAEIQTNARPAIAIHGGSGQIRLLARGGGKDAGLNASPAGGSYACVNEAYAQDPAAPTSGFVFQSLFAGNAWSAPTRVGTGRLPGVSATNPAFTAPVSPVSLYDANTQRIQDLLIGEDAQIYHSTP